MDAYATPRARGHPAVEEGELAHRDVHTVVTLLGRNCRIRLGLEPQAEVAYHSLVGLHSEAGSVGRFDDRVFSTAHAGDLDWLVEHHTLPVDPCLNLDEHTERGSLQRLSDGRIMAASQLRHDDGNNLAHTITAHSGWLRGSAHSENEREASRTSTSSAHTCPVAPAATAI